MLEAAHEFMKLISMIVVCMPTRASNGHFQLRFCPLDEIAKCLVQLAMMKVVVLSDSKIRVGS